MSDSYVPYNVTLAAALAGGAQDENLAKWVDANGVTEADLFGTTQGELFLEALSNITLRAWGSNGPGDGANYFAQFIAQHGGPAAFGRSQQFQTAITGLVTDGATGNRFNALLANAEGQSSFLQLANGLKPPAPGPGPVNNGWNQIAVDWGSHNLTFTASTTASAVVNHGLGRVPQVILAMLAGAITGQYSLSADTLTSTTFTLHGVLPAASSLTLGNYWVAIG